MSNNFIGGIMSLEISQKLLAPPPELLIYKICKRCGSKAYMSRNYYDYGKFCCTGECEDYTEVVEDEAMS